MANYSLIINSRFNPFSYQEMLAPVLMATQAHQELENQYGELSTKANIWEEMANEQTDPYAYKMYKTYANDLEEKAGQLAREGLNVSSRRDMLNMRTRYNKEIVPIEQAYTARQKQAEAQQQALLQDPTMMFSRRAATTSLDDYIRNPQLDYTPYSGKLITAQAAQAASALSKEMIDNPRKWRSILGNSYYERVMQKGFSSAAVLQAIQNNPNAAPELLRIVEDAVNSSGVREWNDKASLDRAYAFARQGLWSAVGETQYQNLDNWRAKMAAQEAMQIRAENRAAAREAAARQEQEAGNVPSLSAQSYLQASGKEAKYLQALLQLKAGQQGLKAAYFGKTGKANPIRIYESVQNIKKNPAKYLSESTKRRIIDEYSSRKGHTMSSEESKKFWKNQTSDQVFNNLGLAAQKELLKLYTEEAGKMAKHNIPSMFGGATSVITKDQYEALKAVGYDGGQSLSITPLLDKLNTLSKEKSYYSTNMSSYEIPDEKIRSNLGNWENNGSFSGRVYKLNSNGTQGESVDYSDMNLKDNDGDGNTVTGIYYSDVTPNKIIVQVGNEGERYLVDPNALGSEVYNFIQTSRSKLSGVSSTERAETITMGITRMLNNYNKTASKTTSKDT